MGKKLDKDIVLEPEQIKAFVQNRTDQSIDAIVNDKKLFMKAARCFIKHSTIPRLLRGMAAAAAEQLHGEDLKGLLKKGFEKHKPIIERAIDGALEEIQDEVTVGSFQATLDDLLVPTTVGIVDELFKGIFDVLPRIPGIRGVIGIKDKEAFSKDYLSTLNVDRKITDKELEAAGVGKKQPKNRIAGAEVGAETGVEQAEIENSSTQLS